MWGWIPHLHSSFKEVFINNAIHPEKEECYLKLSTSLKKESIRFIERSVENDNVKYKFVNEIYSDVQHVLEENDFNTFCNPHTIRRYSDDVGSDHYLLIRFDIGKKEDFDFNKEFAVYIRAIKSKSYKSKHRIRTKLCKVWSREKDNDKTTTNDKTYKANVTISESGLIKIDPSVDSDYKPEDLRVRNLYKEVFYFLKSVFHRDIYHSTDKSADSLITDQTDDISSLTFAKDEKEAACKVIHSYIRACQSTIEEISSLTCKRRPLLTGSAIQESIDRNQHMLCGFILFGRNLIRSTKKIINDDEKYGDYISIMDGFERSASNDIAYDVQVSSMKLNKNMRGLTIISICAAFFAGSIVNEVISDSNKILHIWPFAIIIIIATGYVWFKYRE